jgi:integrase
VTTSYDVRVWAIRVRKDRPKPYMVRWKVGTGAPKAKSFRTQALADSYRSGLVQATRRGEAFDTDSGLPESQFRERESVTWYQHALDYIDVKWASAAGKSRISIVETLTAVTPVLVRSEAGSPHPVVLRNALRRWAFVPDRGDDVPPEVRAALAWLRRQSLPITALQDDKILRRVLDALARKLDGTLAAPDYLSRRRRVFYNVIRYAVREKRLPENPLDTTGWEAPDTSVAEINPRVVASPEKVRDLLAAVSYIGPRRGERLVAFFACLYFAMLRPSEALGLCTDDCFLPNTGWGRLELHQTTPVVGKQWTDTGDRHENRGLKNRPGRAIRIVPIPGELVAILRTHVDRYGQAPDGRLFRSENGGVLYPSAYRYVWQQARALALTPAQVASPLARRPYDLRHGGVSLRLNAGVPATQVAEWAGHSVEVLLTIYAKCIEGRDRVWFERIDEVLGGDPA